MVLLIHSGWWGVAPSPTEEGALRGAHGEHGEPGHHEPHKDSYSTFASEFLESRYLSDDGKLLVDWTGGIFFINVRNKQTYNRLQANSIYTNREISINGEQTLSVD